MPAPLRVSRQALLLATLALARSTAAAPIVVPASEAGRYAGNAVTVEGDVADARVESSSLVLTLVPDDPKGFRVILVLAVISRLPSHPERVYAGKRIRATGIVQRFQGRPEMILESPSQIEVIDVAQLSAATTSSTTAPLPARAPTAPTTLPPPPPPAASPPPPPTPPEAALPVVTSSTAPTSGPLTTTLPPAPEPAARPLLTERLAAQVCASAQARWHSAAEALRGTTDALGRCLDAGAYRCRAAAAAVAPALAELEWAEQNVADRCD